MRIGAQCVRRFSIVDGVSRQRTYFCRKGRPAQRSRSRARRQALPSRSTARLPSPVSDTRLTADQPTVVHPPARAVSQEQRGSNVHGAAPSGAGLARGNAEVAVKAVNPPDLLVSMEGGTGTSLLRYNNIKQRQRDRRMEEGGQYHQADLISSTAMVIKVPGSLQVVAVHWGWADHPKCEHTCNSINTDNRTCLHFLRRRLHSSIRKKQLIQSRWRPTQSAGSYCPPSKNVSCESPIQTEICFYNTRRLPRVSRGES